MNEITYKTYCLICGEEVRTYHRLLQHITDITFKVEPCQTCIESLVSRQVSEKLREYNE